MASQSAAIELGYRARPNDKQAEADLVERACAGDGEAFGMLYEQLVDRVYRYIYFRVTDELTAEDLTSKVFLKAWEHLPRFKRGKSPFIAWLYTIAHNTVVDHYRLSKPTAQLDEATPLPAEDPLPDEQFESRFDAQSLHKALEHLTDLQREVVTMKLIDGIGTDQIAARLHKSPGAVRALQMRALQALAKTFREEEALLDKTLPQN